MAAKFLLLVVSTFLLSECAYGEWRYNDKVAVVTGASSGIGEEIALQLAKKGMTVAAIARRAHRLQELAQKSSGRIHPVTCDLTDEQDIIKAFQWIESHLGGVDVLVNNAGTYLPAHLASGETKDWKFMLDLNVVGLAISSREALKTMRTRGDNGQIININSVAGQYVMHLKSVPNGLYTASKFAVTAMSEALSNELSDLGSKIKVTNLSPGLVMTELITNSTIGNKDFSGFVDKMAHIDVDDIAEGVVYVLSTKQNVHISELTIKQMGPISEC